MPAKILHYRQIVRQKHVECLKDIESQLVLLGDEYMRVMESPVLQEHALLNGEDLALMIKKRMEALNFTLGADIAKSLYHYLTHTVVYTMEVHSLACRHIALLHMAIRNKIAGKDGAMERRMLEDMKMQIKNTG